jgi:hypothetical protein
MIMFSPSINPVALSSTLSILRLIRNGVLHAVPYCGADPARASGAPSALRARVSGQEVALGPGERLLEPVQSGPKLRSLLTSIRRSASRLHRDCQACPDEPGYGDTPKDSENDHRLSAASPWQKKGRRESA